MTWPRARPPRAERTTTSSTKAWSRTGHLRARGADACSARWHCPMIGTPPRARSGPRVLGRRRELVRDTSAGAERTSASRSGTPPGTGHLRERGADPVAPGDVDAGGGTPPRARSGQYAPQPQAAGRRDTSAGAERTRPRWSPRSRRSGHLRGRGADLRADVDPLGVDGTPPRARSGRHRLRPNATLLRDTSAGAERTCHGKLAAPRVSGHLRGRGADPDVGGVGVLGQGHLRGRGADDLAHRLLGGGVGTPPRARSGLSRAAIRLLRERDTSAGAERT